MGTLVPKPFGEPDNVGSVSDSTISFYVTLGKSFNIPLTISFL